VMPLALGRAPSRADWQHDRILADLGRASGGQPVTVAVIPNDNFFSVSNFRYETVRRGLPYRMTRAWSDAPLGVDFVILKSRDQGPSYASARPERLTRAFAGGDPYWISAFPVIAEYPLPDGSTASGDVVGVDASGALVLDHRGRRLRFVTGEVSLRRP